MIGDIKIFGTILQVLPLQSGVSKTGNEWKKAEYLLETIEQYPRKVKFDIFGSDKVDQYGVLCQQNAMVTISANIESHEFNGRWYTDVRAWKVEPGDTRADGALPTAAVPGAPAPGYQNPIVPEAPAAAPAFAEPVIPQFPGAAPEPSATDDLPF